MPSRMTNSRVYQEGITMPAFAVTGWGCLFVRDQFSGSKRSWYECSKDIISTRRWHTRGVRSISHGSIQDPCWTSEPRAPNHDPNHQVPKTTSQLLRWLIKYMSGRTCTNMTVAVCLVRAFTVRYLRVTDIGEQVKSNVGEIWWNRCNVMWSIVLCPIISTDCCRPPWAILRVSCSFL